MTGYATERTLWGTPAPTDDQPGALTPAGRRVWDAFNWFARTSGECWARLQTISTRTGLALRTVQKWLTRLRKWGWIETTRRGRSPALRTRRHAPCALACALKGPRSTLPEGFKNKTMADGVRSQQPPTRARRTGTVRNLPNLTPMDLGDAHRMHQVLAGVLGAYKAPGQADRANDPHTLLNWFGSARRALRIARSPGAAFRWMIANNKAGWITQADEDAARADVAKVLHGRQTRPRPERDAVAEALGEYDA